MENLHQFREIRIIQRLIAERRVAYNGVKGWNNKMGVLEAAIDVIGFGVKILRYGRCRGSSSTARNCALNRSGQRPMKLPLPAADSRIRSFRMAQAQSGQALVNAPDNRFRVKWAS